jgi:hypothetical protein
MREEVALKINLPESRVQVSIKHTTGNDVNKSELEVSLDLTLALDAKCCSIYLYFLELHLHKSAPMTLQCMVRSTE